MLNNDGQLAVFDSGIGGVSVLRELIKLMPNENFLYYADSAHAPYGDKKIDIIYEYTKHAFSVMLSLGCKAVVLACNTATGAAAKRLREENPNFPIIGIEPAVKPAAESLPCKKILVMATPLTLNQEKFSILLNRFDKMAKIIPLPCPGLATLIENGHIDDSDITEYLTELFLPYLNSGIISGIVLGCTHYPFIRSTIQKLLPNAMIFDGGPGTAKQTERLLRESELTTTQTKGSLTVISTDGNNDGFKNKLLSFLK